MTPQLVDCLTRLSPLAPHELALVSATATALMARTVPVPAMPLAPAKLALPRDEPAPRLSPAQPANRAAVFDVPLIGGPALSLEPSLLFTQAAFLARWRPGRRVLVYLGGNRRLAGLMRRLQPAGPRSAEPRRLCAFKVGTHKGTDLGVRLRRVSAEGYGSLWRDSGTVVAEPNWGDWTAEPLNPGSADPAPGSPVLLGIDAIEVVLPATMTPVGFDQRLGKLLSPATLAAFALSPAGRDLCASLGENPARFVRYSPRGAGRPRRATEITLVGRQDIGRLVRLIEQLLLDHVLVETAG